MTRRYTDNFINRTAEKKAVINFINSTAPKENCFVFLLGLDGVGKSSFAEEISYSMERTFITIDLNNPIDKIYREIAIQIYLGDERNYYDFEKSQIDIFENTKSELNKETFISNCISIVKNFFRKKVEFSEYTNERIIKFLIYSLKRKKMVFLINFADSLYTKDDIDTVLSLLFIESKKQVFFIEGTDDKKFVDKYLRNNYEYAKIHYEIAKLECNFAIEIIKNTYYIENQSEITKLYEDFNYNLKKLKEYYANPIEPQEFVPEMLHDLNSEELKVMYVISFNEKPIELYVLKDILALLKNSQYDTYLMVILEKLRILGIVAIENCSINLKSNYIRTVLDNFDDNLGKDIAQGIIIEYYTNLNDIDMIITLNSKFRPSKLIESIYLIEEKAKTYDNYDECERYIKTLFKNVLKIKDIDMQNKQNIFLRLSVLSFNLHFYNLSNEIFNSIKEVNPPNYRVLEAGIIFKQGKYQECVDYVQKNISSENNDVYLLLKILEAMSLKQLDEKTQYLQIINTLYLKSEFKLLSTYPFFLRFYAESKELDETLKFLNKAHDLFIENNYPLQAIHTQVNIAMYLARDKNELTEALCILKNAHKRLDKNASSSLILVNNYCATLLSTELESNKNTAFEKLKVIRYFKYNPFLNFCITINLLNAYYQCNCYEGIEYIYEIINGYTIETLNIPERIKARIYFNILCIYNKANNEIKVSEYKNKIRKNFNDSKTIGKINNSDYTPFVQYDTYWNFELPIEFYQ